MTVDPALWDAFHKAKDALFSAIRVSTPHIPNVLLEAPANRAASRAAIATAIVSLEQIRDAVESTEKEFFRMNAHLQETIARARYSLPPIGALPNEILQEVFLHAAAPREHEMVRTLASINQAWREATLGQRSLFACPKWSKWPIELLELWCSRARGSPLDVLLEDADMTTIHDNKDQRRLQLLQSTKPMWDSLSFHSGWSENEHRDREFVEAAHWLFKDSLPALQTLYFCLQEPSPRNAIASVPISTPNLQILHYSGVLLQPQEPLTFLSELCVLKGIRRPFWTDMLRHTPALETLVIGPHEPERDDHVENEGYFEFPWVTHLAFGGHYARPHLEGALRCIFCPNAMAVGVANEPPSESLFQAITDCMPRILIIKLHGMNGLADVAKAVRVLGTQTALVPLLAGLDLSGNVGEGSGDDAIRTEESFAQYEESVLQLVTVRKLFQLTLPRLSPKCAKRVREHVRNLQVEAWPDDDSMPELPFPPS